MKSSRFVLLVTSTLVVLVLLGGGLAVRLGAEENPFSQPVLFAEVVALVLENYVDPVEDETLLRGAYEGLLAGLDENSAYLTPEELADWKAGSNREPAGPGISVLKRRRTLHVVAVDEGSPAEAAGISVGDQIRTIDGLTTRDLSLQQSRRKIGGAAGSSVRLGLVRPRDNFSREELVVDRAARQGRAYELDVREGVAVLRVLNLEGTPADRLAAELDDVRSRGVERLLLDLRNLADDTPRSATTFAGLFVPRAGLRLRDRAGQTLEELEGPAEAGAWEGSLSVLVNGYTAGASEAVAQLLREGREAELFGATTFGLGTETELVELENGAALLLSAAIWETSAGTAWNDGGLTPDREVAGHGDDFEEFAADQLEQVLELLSGDDAQRELPEAA